MVIGFKTGPKNFNEGQRIVLEEGARMCEVWFDVTQQASYQNMFTWFATHHVSIGLHHWGLVDGKYKTNLMSEDAHIRAVTLAQMKQTVDIAQDIGAVYVNVHPGAQAIEVMDFRDETQNIATDKPATPRDTATRLLLEGAVELTEYASKKGVLVTIENLPALEKTVGRTYDPLNATLDDATMLGTNNIFLANDITHAAAQLAAKNPDPSFMWEHVLAFTKETQAATRLLHINTVEPPYTGADSHGGITGEDFGQERFPSQSQLVTLLSLFKNRKDVFVIPEPRDKMHANYAALQELARLAQAE